MKRIGKHVAAEIRLLDTNHHWVFNKRVHGYENGKVETCGNQTVAAEPTETNEQRIIEELLRVVTSIRSFPKF
jgi:hypothetical protein